MILISSVLACAPLFLAAGQRGCPYRQTSMLLTLLHVMGISPRRSERLRESLVSNPPVRNMVRFLGALNLSFRRAFDDDAFAVAKAAAYSSILTFFPALLVLGAVLASSHRFGLYVAEICDALGSILPTGRSTAVEYVTSKAFHPVGS